MYKRVQLIKECKLQIKDNWLENVNYNGECNRHTSTITSVIGAKWRKTVLWLGFRCKTSRVWLFCGDFVLLDILHVSCILVECRSQFTIWDQKIIKISNICSYNIDVTMLDVKWICVPSCTKKKKFQKSLQNRGWLFR